MILLAVKLHSVFQMSVERKRVREREKGRGKEMGRQGDKRNTEAEVPPYQKGSVSIGTFPD